MAAGNRHGCSVAGADVGEGQENVMQFESGVLRVVMSLRVPDPLSVGQGREPVVGLVESTHLGGIQRSPQHQKPL